MQPRESRVTLLTACLLLCGNAFSAEKSSELAPGQWSAERARTWYAAQPWLVGCNFLPSTAVNDVEMWQGDTFDAAAIERELDWARDLGFNTVRVFVNYVVWRADAEGLRNRLNEVLAIAAKHRISVMPVLLDDCNFAGREAKAGPQPDPVPGVHNSQWVSSPPLQMVTDRSAWPNVQKYVQAMIGAFGRDPRVVVWDLYNEPGNSALGERSLPLVEAAFAWARETKPSQPLTVGVWTGFDGEMSQRMFALSDVVSFHAYDDPPGVRAKIARCASFGRPVLCTEWLRRQTGNTFESLLPMFDEHQVGCYNWGLVAGRTQTYYPWGSPQNAPEPAQWQHDIFRGDGSPFSRSEWGFVKAFFGRLTASVTEVVPTARKEPVTWRYTMDDPGEGWFQPDFNDTAWRKGAAPFGKHEPPIGRAPRTEWTTKSIWLRRAFTLPEGRHDDAWLIMHFDEEPEVYLNGILAAKPEKWSGRYESVAISPDARAALKPGPNTMAVRCRQTWGGQFIDVGIGVLETASRESQGDERR